MGPDEIRATVLRVLGDIAPEADLGRVKPAVSFRDQLDLDSMDFLNFVIALHHALRVDIPEVDYPKLATLDGCVEYLAALGTAPRGEAAR
jgi:acyl carrier protein